MLLLPLQGLTAATAAATAAANVAQYLLQVCQLPQTLLVGATLLEHLELPQHHRLQGLPSSAVAGSTWHCCRCG